MCSCIALFVGVGRSRGIKVFQNYFTFNVPTEMGYSSLFRRFIIPKVRYSEGLLF